ncbi:hypothetical protein DL764_004212 [Monosporascus ibericus]|uniref:Uncharacterized protein n=1 Tax=Monosporascus ibericus TaxID=155417 RepID=A0A4Q4TDG3_9PEZI|nr:hypothetical protein DL764_004212 [Monosporascus ibericus]
MRASQTRAGHGYVATAEAGMDALSLVSYLDLPTIASSLILANEDGSFSMLQADSFGRTPLSWAACGGSVSVAPLLLESGCDVNRCDKGGYDQNEDSQTPLFAAASNGRAETVKILLDAGADAKIADNSGQTPLLRAVFNQH